MGFQNARIFLIDDHPAVRQGLRLALYGKHHDICGEAADINGTLDAIDNAGANVAILDLSLDEESGLDLIATLRERNIAVLIYSMHEDLETIQRAFAAGANAYVSKREMTEVIQSGILSILAGEHYVSPHTAKRLATQAIPASPAERQTLLSAREREILNLLGQGETNTAIATTLAISVRTVETHFARMANKLGLEGVKELRRFAIQRKKI